MSSGMSSDTGAARTDTMSRDSGKANQGDSAATR
jgi:hypothetical protein